MALLAQRRFDTRAAHREAVLALESQNAFEGMQRFLAVAAVLAGERRLSRMVFLARKVKGVIGGVKLDSTRRRGSADHSVVPVSGLVQESGQVLWNGLWSE